MRIWFAVLAIGLITPAVGQQQGDGRYALQPLPDGVARLDTRTGEVSHCRREGEALVCRLAADERRTLEAEIARLSRENTELRGRAPRNMSPTDLDQALDTMERFLDRAKRIFDRWRLPDDRT